MISYYFIGIGGISMSALARLLFKEGNILAGSDAQKSQETENLKKLGISVFYKPNLRAIKAADIVVVSSAISPKDKELVEAKRLGKTILTRGQLLGQIASGYKHVIAVSGAHGKTTTTALIAHIFMTAGLNPTVHIGGVMIGQTSSLIYGDKNFFVTEACEYKDNFLSLHPEFSIVLNVEPEHLDYFKTFDNVKKSFKQFTEQSKNFIAQNGLFDSGLKLGKDYGYTNFNEDENGIAFDVMINGEFAFFISCSLHGEHNASNILAAIAASKHFNIADETIEKALKTFKGVKRRCENHEFYNNSKLIFDYAHHPTEIECSIEAAKKFCRGELIVLFQPHTYSRTIKLFDDFLTAFKAADELYIFKTYPAREKYVKEGSAKELSKKLNTIQPCKYLKNYGFLKTFKNKLSPEDIVLVLGAGDFYDKCKF